MKGLISKLKQVSKLVTFVLLLIDISTWLIIVIQTWGQLEYLNLLSEFTLGMVRDIIPYFSLTAIERISNWDIIKSIKKGG